MKKPKVVKRGYLLSQDGRIEHEVMLPETLPQIIRVPDRKYYVLDPSAVEEGMIVYYTRTLVYDLPANEYKR
jgi:hypothetical protein